MFLASSSSARTRCACISQRRLLSLVADHHSPSTSTSSEPPLIILHGLYGSRQNWRSLSKSLSKALKKEIVALDLRNHGESPHEEGMGYEVMAKDVAGFIADKDWKEVDLLGHSMGGKVAMALALSGSSPIKRLISVDMSPAKGHISKDFMNYLHAMKDISSKGVKSRKEADQILQEIEKDISVRQFLLTNLVRSDETGTYSFRIPLDHLQTSLEKGEIGDFPSESIPEGEEATDVANGVVRGTQDTARRYERDALFLKGARSKYINNRNIPSIQGFFPKAQIETLDAGHWVHAEKPKEFVESLQRFLA